MQSLRCNGRGTRAEGAMSRACRAMKNICRQSEDALDALDTRRGPHARQLACGTPMWEETESRSAVARRSLHRMVFKVYERQGSEHGRREERQVTCLSLYLHVNMTSCVQQEGKRLSPALLGLLGINFLGGREERGEKDLIERLEQLFKEGKHQEIKARSQALCALRSSDTGAGVDRGERTF
eukprot:754989-Hanusia_phi.AAC.4